MKKELSLRQIQLRELALLQVFDAVCTEHHLRYSLCSGTLLGAVRHQGFIPWDDDIDVQMPRPDYDKLLSLAPELQTLHLRGYGISSRGSLKAAPFVRAVDLETRLEQQYLDNENNRYLYMDILPLDGFPASESARKRIIRRQEILKKCLYWANIRKGAGRTRLRRMLHAPAVALCKAVGPDKIATQISNLARRIPFDTSEDIAVIGGNFYGTKETMPREQWLNTTTFPFEGRSFSCMGCWQLHLTRLYGDYMQLPPEEKRVAHHTFTAWMEDPS